MRIRVVIKLFMNGRRRVNKEIEKLSMTNHIVNKCLDWHKYNQGVSYQEALEKMVILLAESNDALINMAVENWRGK